MGRPKGSNRYKAQQFIEAIPGTGGIITAIAKRVGCDWHTAKKYIEEYATVKRAYDDECETPKDWAESVIVRNIALSLEKQKKTNEPVDSSDAKWYLTHKGKDRGYAKRTEVTGAEGGAVELELVDRLKRVVEMSEDEFTDFAGNLPDLGSYGTLEEIAEVEG